MGALIKSSAGFTGAFVACVIIEALFLVVLLVLARETRSSGLAAQPAE